MNELASLRFQMRAADADGGSKPWLDIHINGESFRDQLGLTRSYVTPFGGWTVSLLESYAESLLGEAPGEMASGRVPLYVCEMCGDPDCGTVTARVTLDGDRVIWSEFSREVNYFLEVSGDQNESFDFPPVHFDRTEYEQAVRGAVEIASAKDLGELHTARHAQNRQKMSIRMKVDRHDWPPFAVESLWVEPLGGDRYKVDNTPFFAFKIAVNDIVRAKEKHGVLWYRKSLQSGGYCAIRIIVWPDGPLGGSHERAMKFIEPFGVGGEGFPEYNLIALDVPPAVDIVAFKTLLREKAAEGAWAFEEAAITKQWRDA